MLAQSRTESTRDTYNYGQYINQFPPEYDKSNTGIRTDPEENMSIMFNEICINEEMLPIYIYIYIYIYISRRILTVKAAGLNPHSGSHWKWLSRRQRRRLVSLNYRVTHLLGY